MFNAAAVFSWQAKDTAALAVAESAIAVKRKRIDELTSAVSGSPCLEQLREMCGKEPVGQTTAEMKLLVADLSEIQRLKTACTSQSKRLKKLKRTHLTVQTVLETVVGGGACANTPSAFHCGQVSATRDHTIGGRLVFVRDHCDGCSETIKVTVMSVGVVCSSCDDRIAVGCTDPETYREEIEKHVVEEHGDAVMSCPFLCGTVLKQADENVWKHWASCHYNPRNAPTTRSTATRTGVGGQNTNLIWREVPSVLAANSTCDDCGQEANHLTAAIDQDTVRVRCRDCEMIAGPNSPVHMTSSVWTRLLQAPDRPIPRQISF